MTDDHTINPHNLKRLKQLSSPSKRLAFTLIELLVVITIIMILMTMIVGAGSIAYRKAMIARTQTKLQKIETAMQEYYITVGAYPVYVPDSGLGESLNHLTNRLPALGQLFPDGVDALDAWGNQFVYTCKATSSFSHAIWSLGPDGKSSTSQQREDDVYPSQQ